MGWHPCWVTWTRIRVIGVNFYQGKRNLVRVSGEFELSELELTELKWLKSGVKSKENGTWFELAGEFKLSQFELPGFYRISCNMAVILRDSVVAMVVRTRSRTTPLAKKVNSCVSFSFLYEYGARRAAEAPLLFRRKRHYSKNALNSFDPTSWKQFAE